MAQAIFWLLVIAGVLWTIKEIKASPGWGDIVCDFQWSSSSHHACARLDGHRGMHRCRCGDVHARD